MAERDKQRLLIVEDDVGLQRQLKWCFEDYEVVLASTRAEALAELRRHEPPVVLQRVVEGEGNFGYNAASGEYGDLVAMGVLDPCKVTRTALQNAASIAGLVLTTDCMIAQIPQKAAAPMGGEGGMPE